MRNILASTLLIASIFSAGVQVAHAKPIEAKAIAAAEQVCPIIARSSPATLEYNIDQLTRELDRAGFTQREQRLVVQKCRNWKA